MKNNEELNELMYELALMHKAALFYAGVKEDKLEEAAFKYLDLLDDNDVEDDFDLIISTVDLLKVKYPEFFN